MAKRRLNKNLVGYLTAAGIFLAVVVVAITALNASRRDPEAIASRAAAKEKAGDFESAVRLYKSAYAVDNEAKYLIEAARVERDQGKLIEMFGLLNLAHTQSPRDPVVLTALLKRYWEMRQYSIGQWGDVLERADSLLELSGQENNLLALASKVDALDRLKASDPAYAEAAETTLARAVAIDPRDPRVALVSAEHNQRLALEKARQARLSGDRDAGEKIMQAALSQQEEILRLALEDAPDDIDLRVALAGVLAANEKWDAARACLETGLAKNPDNVDLGFAMAGMIAETVRRSSKESSVEQVRKLVDEGLAQIDKVIASEPALYMAYIRKAELLRMGWEKDGTLASEPLKRQKAILETYSNALDSTVGLRSIRAALGAGARLQLIANAFDTALNAYRRSDDDEVRNQALTYVRRFMQEGQTQYAEHALTPLMEGHVALIDGDERLAILSFGKAVEQADKRGEGASFGRLAKEELVKIYNHSGQLGLASQYATEVLGVYDRIGAKAPLWLWLSQIDVLIRLAKPQDALDLIDSISGQYPDNDAIRAARAKALALLNRGEEASQVLAASDKNNPRVIFQRAQVESINKNYGAAAKLLEQLLQTNSENESVVRMYLDVLVADGRSDEAIAYVNKHVDQVKDARLRRTMQTYRVLMSESDPEKRKEQLLAVIAEVPDDFERAHEYFSFWATNGDFERSLPYLDTMEKLHPDDVEVKRLQLDMALQLQRCDRAEKYVAILAQLNADQAGGALFRGRYELDCGDLENALREFRTVEREFPNDASLKVRIAQTLLRMKPPRLTEALQSLELAVEFDPRSFAAQSLLYTCYEELGRGSEGIEHLRIAAELNPNNEFIKKRKELLDEELDPRAGIERREQRRAQNPDDVNNLVRLAQLYQRVGDNEQAGARLNEAVQLDPSNLRAVRGGLTLYADVGDRAAGEKLMDAYAQSQKETVGKVFASVMRAQFYERLGDVEAAYTAYQRACDDSAAMPKDKPADRRRAIARSTREMAEFFRRNNRAEDMIEAYRVVLDNLEKDDTPSIQVCRRAIIRGYLALRQFGEARKELDGYRRDYPDDAAGMLAEAELLVSQPNRQLDDARKLLTRVLDEYPDNAWARYMRGRINMAQGRYEEARDDLLHAKSVSPEGFNLQHRLSLVRLYEITERSDLAEAELREMLSIDRSDRSVELELVNLLNRTGQYEKAQEFVSQMIAADPSEPFWRYQLGLALETREEYSAAVEPYRKAIEIMHQRGANPPENVCVHLISCLVRGNRAAEALQFYDSLGPLTVTPRIQTAAAEACLAADRHDLAVGLVEQAVGIACRRTTGELRSVVARAMTDEMLGRDETLEIVRRVLANPPSEQSELVLKNILALYLATDKDADKRAEGGRLLKSVLDATKPGEEAHVDALLVKAQLTDVEGGDPEAVIAIYEEVLRESPDNLQALNNLAYRLADVLDRPAEALPYAERLSDLASDNANVLDTVAWVEFKNGKNDEAVATLQDVLRMAPDHLAARFHLGLIYAKAGQRTAAKRSLRRALELAVERDNKDYQTKAQEALNNLR